jgi:hypothetical protein
MHWVGDHVFKQKSRLHIEEGFSAVVRCARARLIFLDQVRP